MVDSDLTAEQLGAVQMRGSGRTTRQMKAAPKGALFIWGNPGSLAVPMDIALDCGRDDLIIASIEALWGRNTTDRIMGRPFPAIILDHALAGHGLTPLEVTGYRALLAQVRP